MKKTILTGQIALIVVGAIFFTACVAPINTSFENARPLGRNTAEVMGNYSHYIVAFEGESEKMNDNFGIRLGYGLNENTDVKFRYEYMRATDNEGSAQYLEFYPKIRMYKDHLAGMLPVGVYLYDGEEGTETTFVISPRVLGSYAFNDHFEATLGGKVDFYLEEDVDPTIAFNLGFGIGKNVKSSFSVRPEIAMLFDPGESDIYWSFSLGICYPFSLKILNE